MGDYAFSFFKSSLTYELGKREDIASYVGAWCNAALMDFCTRDSFPGMKTGIRFSFPQLIRIDTSKATADGGKYIAAPSALLHIYTIKDTTSDRKLNKISVREYADKSGLDTAASESAPTEYCRIYDKIYFFPVPDDIYALEIYYRKRPATMSAEADTTEIDAMWDDPILKLAVIQSMRRLHLYEQAELESKAWLETMAAKVAILGEEDKDFNHIIQPDYAYKATGRR